jgi:hypothetical protein
MPISVTQAWAEATASTPKDEVMLVTIELLHSTFVENGAPAPVRAVRDTADLVARLEEGAPFGGGGMATFRAIWFEIDYPRIGQLGAECRIRIDNVSRVLGPALEAAAKLNEPVRAIFRGYLASDPQTVGQGPYNLVLRQVTRRNGSVEGSLSIAQPRNLRVMREVYDMVRFPSLLQVS